MKRTVVVSLGFAAALSLAAAGSPAAVADPTGVDVTRLPVGDNKYSSSPKEGYVWACRITTDPGGASSQGPWFNGDGTWNLNEKLEVDGDVDWQEQFSHTLQGDTRVITSNGLPNHHTGTYPIESSDDVYAYDRNQSSISAQSDWYELPANPTVDDPECVGGEVGVLLTGARLFNAFDAGMRDAAAWEAQDMCGGHPQNMGVYHYHSLSECWDDQSSGHSALLGYALDGFGIYGHHGTDGATLTNGDLDACHGHTHSITWDGSQTSMYHYHTTYEFPYTVGCYGPASTSTGDVLSREVTLRITEKGDRAVARGSVSASSEVCEQGVEVEVERRAGGRWKDVGDDRTGGGGTYRTRIANEAGKYRAHASRDTISGIVCGNAVSDAVRIRA